MAEAKSPAPPRRRWIDALVATALRWNDRLSQPVRSRAKGSAAAASASSRIRVDSAAEAAKTGTSPAK
jgi:hypothetical protein